MGADKELIRKRFETNFHQYHRLATVQREICSELAGLISEFCDTGSIGSAMEIGVGTGFLSLHLLKLYPEAKWYFNDISEASRGYVSGYLPNKTSFIWGDAENIEIPEGQDLIASASTVQWFDDLSGFALRAASAIKRGGWLAISTFGPDNFREIRDTTGEGLDYYTLAELETILRTAGYEVLSSREYARTMHFASPLDVLHHIKATGVNSLGRTRWGRRQFADFEAKYRVAHAVVLDEERDGLVSPAVGVCLTYHPILMVARKL